MSNNNDTIINANCSLFKILGVKTQIEKVSFVCDLEIECVPYLLRPLNKFLRKHEY